MLLSYAHDADSVILRVKLLDSSQTDGRGITGLLYNSTGLRIGAMADVEATTTSYTTAGATIEDITTLGTYAAPTASKCRFKEVDSTNHPGVYELQLANTRFAVANAKFLLVSISGVTNLAQCDFLVRLNAAADFPVDVRQWVGGTPNALQTGRVDGYVGATATGALTSSSFAAGAINAAAIADDAIDAASIATGALTADAFAADALVAGTFATDCITNDAIAASAATEVAAAVHGTNIEAEGTVTHQEAMSLILALLTGVTTVAGATYTVKTHDGVATRVVFTLNASKERTAVTLTPSA